MALRALTQFLDGSKVSYRAYNHSPTFTAQNTAHVIHTSGYEVAKVVVVKVDYMFALAVLAACEKVDLARFKEQTNALWVSLATEAEIEKIAPLCDLGSIPPIGNLFGLPVFVSTTLAEDDVISFNAGNHTEEIRMAYEDFEKLVQPRVMDFQTH